MKLLFCGLVFCLSIALPTCCCAQKAQSNGQKVQNPINGGLKNITKEKILWQGTYGYLSGNFNYTRDVAACSFAPLIQRSSSYTLPVLYGRKLGGNWALEGGPFAGLTRERFMDKTFLQTEDPLPARNEFSYGLLCGLRHQVTDLMSLQVRYRADLNATPNAWQPVQAGWSLRF